MPVITVSKEVYEYLNKLREEFGLSYSDIIMILIKVFNSNEIPSLLEEQNKLLRRQNEILEEICKVLKDLKSIMIAGQLFKREVSMKKEVTISEKFMGLPSFVVDNPWLEVLAKKGRF